MAVTWSPSPTDAWVPAVENYLSAVRAAVDKLVYYYAGAIEAWMKLNAPWTDRSSNARQTLSTEVERLARDMWSILLAGGVDYFVFLELAHQGRYAIIAPAMNHFGPRLFDDLRAILS